MKNKFAFIALISFLASTASAAQPQSTDSLRVLQTLGVQIKSASEHAKAGRQPEGTALVDIENRLMRLRESSVSDPQLQRKYQAIAMLFGNLKHQATHPQPTPGKPDKPPTRAQIDVEVVTDHHGASCANALGISEKLPVSLTLGQTAGAHNDAWFRFESDKSGYVRFTTDSTGPDPALEVFDGCGADAAKLANNDDALGLDAAVSVYSVKGKMLSAHLTNSGQGGRALVSVINATSTLSGNVKDLKTGFTIDNAEVNLFDSNGFGTGNYGYTDTGGNYSIAIYNPGDYYVRADVGYGGSSYVPQLYPSGSCFPGSYGINTCDLANAQTVAVANGATVSNINFALSTGQRIAGQVRDTSNQPLSNANVYLYDGSGAFVLQALSTDGFGRYAFSTLPPGIYKIETQAGGHGSAMFNQIPCSGPLQTDCDLSQAGSLIVANNDITGVDFALPQLAAISGTVNTNSPSPPLNYGQIYVLDANGNTVAWSNIDFNGHYIAGPLAPGNYFVQASFDGYFWQLFNGIDCASDCTQERPSATQISIATIGQQAQADFHLNVLPTVRGHVQDAASGLPLANVAIELSATSPAGGGWAPIRGAATDVNGDYTLSGTPPGQYYVWARSDDHIDQLYPSVACEGLQANYSYYFTTNCDVANATLLTISLGQTPGAFDFALDASSEINGQVITRTGIGSDFPANTFVAIYDASGTLVADAATDLLGNYAVNDLPPGTYFAESPDAYYSSWATYIPQIWQQMDCVSTCDPTTGTPIPVTANTAVGGVDFQLTRLDAIVGRVTNVLGDPIGGTVIDLFDSTNGNYVGSGVADAQGYYVVPAYLDNSYYVATEGGPSYVNQLYSGVSCPLGPAYFGLCPFNAATSITISSFDTQPHIVDFVLQSNDPIFANGFE